MSPLVDLVEVSKGYGGVQALNAVSFSIEAGTVHALVGENGAGKSTLVKILTGVVQPDDGGVRIDGEPQRIGSPQDAHRLGMQVPCLIGTAYDDGCCTVADRRAVVQP